MHHSSKNDGTIAITGQIAEPMQGTYVGREPSGGVVVAKGIVRPPLININTGEIEKESAVSDAAFGRSIQEAPKGTFYRLKEVGRERCNMAYQTVLFSTADPAAFIEHDSKRFKRMTALDLLGNESSRKVKYGVPVGLLAQKIAPWDMLRKYKAKGVRATVYGSELVPDGYSLDAEGSAIVKALADAGWDFSQEWTHSSFMLLPESALELVHMCSADCVDKLIGRWFMVHRDPALPDGTSLYPAKFAGVCKFSGITSKAKFGIVLNPRDPYWKAAGGDFDGDAASIFIATKQLLPRGPISRQDYKINGINYISQDVGQQMLEAASNRVTELLGPIILNSMRLVERDLGTDRVRALAAGIAQGSVQAKKHSVDIEGIIDGSNYITSCVKQGDEYGDYPYLSTFFNNIKNAVGLQAKCAVWQSMMQNIDDGIWSNGTEIEKALTRRVRALNVLYKDMDFFTSDSNARLPQTLRDAAVARTSQELGTAVQKLTDTYRSYARELNVEFGDLYSEPDIEDYASALRDEMASMRERFRMIAILGRIGDLQVSPKEAQIALVAYGPHKIAAQLVPADVFEELGIATKRVIVNLCDNKYNDGEIYKTADLKPVPGSTGDFNTFAKKVESCLLRVISISKTGRSTRVLLTTS